MTVKELITELEKIKDKDMSVMIEDEIGYLSLNIVAECFEKEYGDFVNLCHF